MSDLGIKYDLNLVEKVSNILATDFWVFEGFNSSMVPVLKDPVKFSANCSIFVKKGNCSVDIDLIKYDIKAPCIVNIRRQQIMQLCTSSSDFDSSFIVLSKRFCEALFHFLKEFNGYSLICNSTVATVPENLTHKFDQFYHHIIEISQNSKEPYSYEAMIYTIASFFYECGYKCYEDIISQYPKGPNRIAKKFLSLVQQNFRTERFLEFYSEQIGVTPKHLSRVVKNMTGYTAVDWIDKYVILEAQVLLRSSNLTIQQISDELHFASQSFFGKYFKKHTGQSPKEFRNS